jgi:hypothetical protein
VHQPVDGPRAGNVVPGSLASLETTIPPTPLKSLLAADGASVYVWSVDRDLIDTVERAAGDQYPIYAADEWLELLALIETEVCHIVLLDSDLVGPDLPARIAQIRAASPAVVIIVAAPRVEAE